MPSLSIQKPDKKGLQEDFKGIELMNVGGYSRPWTRSASLLSFFLGSSCPFAGVFGWQGGLVARWQGSGKW